MANSKAAAEECATVTFVGNGETFSEAVFDTLPGIFTALDVLEMVEGVEFVMYEILGVDSEENGGVWTVKVKVKFTWYFEGEIMKKGP